MQPRRFVLVALGGATGTAVRWALVEGAGSDRSTTAVLVANLLGSLLIGVIAAKTITEMTTAEMTIAETSTGEMTTGETSIAQEVAAVASSRRWAAAGVGFCGGLTTFSTFAVQAADELASGDAASGLGIIALTAAGTVVAVLVGQRIAQP